MELRWSAKKVFDAVRNKATDVVTGGDMAILFGMLERDDLFANKIIVQKTIQNRNKSVDWLADQLLVKIEEYKQMAAGVRKP